MVLCGHHVFLLTYFPHHLQVPQLDRRPEAPWLLSPPVSLFLLFTRWSSATRLPPPGQHLQPPSHPFLSRVLTSAHTNSHTTGPNCSYQAQACTTLLRQHWQSTPEQVRRACVCVIHCGFWWQYETENDIRLNIAWFYSEEFSIMGFEIT